MDKQELGALSETSLVLLGTKVGFSLTLVLLPSFLDVLFLVAKI